MARAAAAPAAGRARRAPTRSRPAPLLLALALVATAAAAARMPYAQGEEVLITGVVTDGQGRPIPELTVTLEASRAAFKPTRLRRERGEAARVATTSDARGEFRLPWRWDDYYNRFELVVELPMRTAEGERPVELQRVDLSRRILHGSPVVSALEVADTSLIESTRAFLAELDSDDERKVYEQMGQPERMESLDAGASSEVTWWYFRHGRAYRFRDGTLRQVIPFEPVEPFSP